MVLSCGRFRLLYQNGFVRYIRYGGQEIVRMIYFALRDENWSTYPLSISQERIESTGNGFLIRYEAVSGYTGHPMIQWHVRIEGTDAGEIIFHLDGEVLRDHRKNRAGFCVLHPLQNTIGSPVIISHPDGTSKQWLFPVFIAPDNPFTEIREMKWKAGDYWYALHFEGDIFETEDQRNWSDASFKTFCTPIRFPFPVVLTKGERISQKVSFRPAESLPLIRSSEEISITLTGHRLQLPRIGIGSSPSEEFTEGIFDRLRSIGLDHYRIDVDLTNIEWQDSFTNDVLISERLELPLEIALQLPEDPRDEIDAFLNLVDIERVPVHGVTVLSKGYPTTREHHLAFIPVLRDFFHTAVIGAGTDFNFTELNRHRFPSGTVDYVTFALDPQEHATDDLTIIENLEAQYYGVISARQIYGAPVHVSPVLMKRKYNPYATDPAAFIIPEAEREEPRQRTPFCAVWTLGCVKKLTDSQASSVTFFHAVGKHGIISEEGEPYPVFDTLKTLKEFAGKNPLQVTTSSAPLNAEAFVDDNNNVLIWNYTDEIQEVVISHLKKKVSLNPREVKVVSVSG